MEDLLSADCICLAMGCSEGTSVSGTVACDTTCGDERGASGISGIGARPLADFGLPSICFFDGSRTPFGRVDMGLKSVALSLLRRRPEESRDGRGPILTLGLYSYEFLVVFIDGLLDWMEGRRPSMLDLVSRKVSSNALLVVPLSSELSPGVGGRALSTFIDFGGGEPAAFGSGLGKVLGARESEKLSVLSGWA